MPTGAVRLSDFFPFGPDFDEALETGNDPSVAVDLTQPIPYFGQIRNRIIVSFRHSSDMCSILSSQDVRFVGIRSLSTVELELLPQYRNPRLGVSK